MFADQALDFARLPRKFPGQSNYHGSYWFAGMGASIWHESLTEYLGLMLIDHLHEVRAVYPQPFLITFADGRSHYPDFLVVHADQRRTVIDVHPTSTTTEADKVTFENTRTLLERIGWRYELLTEMDPVHQANFEFIAGYRHPRYRPTDELEAKLLMAAARRPTFGSLREALRSDRPGEHLPAVYHLMWRRQIGLDLTTPFTDRTQLWKGASR
ncbi:hypothetical protein ASE68_03180 [Agromyces sp. Leaf222]|nr:hypothetical protein ASE68_03180 [Agromyces sp. Leaf222]